MSKFLPESTNNVEKKTSKFSPTTDQGGKITQTIGQGENAKNSIVFLTIAACFTMGAILTILVTIDYWCFRQKEKVPDFIGDVKVVWEILLPIITLSLGYAGYSGTLDQLIP